MLILFHLLIIINLKHYLMLKKLYDLQKLMECV